MSPGRGLSGSPDQIVLFLASHLARFNLVGRGPLWSLLHCHATCPPHPTSSHATHLPTTLCAATLLLPKSANEDSIMPVAATGSSCSCSMLPHAACHEGTSSAPQCLSHIVLQQQHSSVGATCQLDAKEHQGQQGKAKCLRALRPSPACRLRGALSNGWVVLGKGPLCWTAFVLSDAGSCFFAVL